MRKVSSLWGEFLREVVAPSVGVGCEEYYRRVADWALLHSHEFGAEVMDRTGLSVLARLDVRLYLSSEPGVAPRMELSRLSAFVPKTLEGVAEALGNTLREIVTVWSPKDCPTCGGPMRTLVALSAGERRIFLSCRDCPHEEWLDGSPITALIERVIPARVDKDGRIV